MITMRTLDNYTIDDTLHHVLNMRAVLGDSVCASLLTAMSSNLMVDNKTHSSLTSFALPGTNMYLFCGARLREGDGIVEYVLFEYYSGFVDVIIDRYDVENCVWEEFITGTIDAELDIYDDVKLLCDKIRDMFVSTPGYRRYANEHLTVPFGYERLQEWVETFTQAVKDAVGTYTIRFIFGSIFAVMPNGKSIGLWVPRFDAGYIAPQGRIVIYNSVRSMCVSHADHSLPVYLTHANVDDVVRTTIYKYVVHTY